MRAPHPDRALVASWWAWINDKIQQSPLTKIEICSAIGKNYKRSLRDGGETVGSSTYLSQMKNHGNLPPREVVSDIARVMGLSEAEALLQAGYAPLRSEAFWDSILSDQAPLLDSSLNKSVAALADLTPAEQRLVAGFLQGVQVGRQLAEVA